MSTYLDTSLIVALLTPEGHSELARQWLDGQSKERFATSWWTEIEVASALALKRQLRLIDEAIFARARVAWRSLLDESLVRLDVGATHATATVALFDEPNFALRAGDALHVAIVRAAGMTLATLDRRMASQARLIGLDVAAILPD